MSALFVIAPLADGEESSLNAGLNALMAAMPERFAAAPHGGCHIRFEYAAELGRGFAIGSDSPNNALCVRYGERSEAFRALGVLLGQAQANLPLGNIAQTRAFEWLGVMLDVSRNGVLQMEKVQSLIQTFALMGINQLMLYTEDTYEIPNEPNFGYFRGGYTQKELRAMDDYAHSFGIEVVPCIQTLGHMEQTLKWPRYRPLQDAPGVLLAQDKDADAFIEKMIVAASAPVRSKRIHIGMDEADGVGAGIYRVRHGARPAFAILAQHLETTVDTCKKHGLRPMIWSDMFFRLGSKTNNYYDPEATIAPETIARVPHDVDFIYWDYYHDDQAFYEAWIDRHRAMGKEPIYAGGVWVWARWWAQLPHSLKTLRAGMAAARAKGLKEAVVTLWNDDGAQGDFDSSLPGVQFFVEMAYDAPENARKNAAINLAGICQISFDAWVDASNLDLPPAADPDTYYQANPSMWIFWNDPMTAFFDQHVGGDFADHYARLSQRLHTAAKAGLAGDKALIFPAQVAAVLALKSALMHSLRPAYVGKDTATLARLSTETLPRLREALTRLQKMHAALWQETYRPFGWEVLQYRYAGLLSRLDTLAAALSHHLTHPDCPIETLDCPSTALWPDDAFFKTTFKYREAATPSSIY